MSPETLKNYGKREYKELVQATFVDTTQATVQETIATTADPKDKESQVEEVDVYEVRRFNETCKFLYAFYRVVFSKNNPATSLERPKYPQTKLNPRKDTIIWPSFSWMKVEEF